MLSPPTQRARLPGYDLSEPTEADARAAMQRVFGPDGGEARWADACRDAGIAPGHVRTQVQLARVAGALASQGGPAAVVARSVEIRLRTYARLAANAAATPGGQG